MASSYLERIKINSSLTSSAIGKYLSNIRIVVLLVVTIVLLGIVSFINLPRRLNPEVKIPIVTVVTTLPGASPEDVERLVTIPIENKLQGITGIDQLTSQSRDNVSVLSMQFFTNVTQDKAKEDVQAAIDSVTDLPEDAGDPSVSVLDFEDQPIWQFAVTNKFDDIASLMRFSQELKDNLETLPNIDRVNVSGFETQDIEVIISPEKIAQYGVNPLLVSQAIKTASASFPGGLVETSNNSFSVTLNPTLITLSDLRNLPLSIAGQPVKLGDIASISERSAGDTLPAFIANDSTSPRRAVTFSVFKISSSKIDQAANEAHKRVDEIKEKYENRFEVTTILNTAEEITHQFTDLLGEFRSTIILVFVCLFVFLGLRQAIISSITVPLTFLSAFFLMSILGMSINFLSMFAFLLALGLLIDDTIVVVSAMTSYFKSGRFTPHETGLLVWRDTIVPIWSTTITTIWSFVPLLLSAGIIGEFIKPIPVVVTVTMLSSTAIAVLITLPFMIVLLRPTGIARRVVILGRVVGIIVLFATVILLLQTNPLMPIIALIFLLLTFVFVRVRKPLSQWSALQSNKLPWLEKIKHFFARSSSKGIVDIEGFADWYHRFIAKILGSKSSRRKVIFGIVAYSIIGFLLVPTGQVKTEFFPKIDAQTLFVNVELPSGTLSQTTTKETLQLLDQLRHNKDIEFATASHENEHTANITLHLKKENSIEAAKALRENLKTFDKGNISVVEESGGPPAGADVQITLLGEDLGQLNLYADQAADFLKTQPGITNVKKSVIPGTSSVAFVPDTTKLAAAGISTEQLGLALRTFASGFTLDEMPIGESQDDTEIVFRFDHDRQSVESLGRINLPTQTGMVPLSNLGKFMLRANPTQITREGGKRSITISAGVEQGHSVQQKNADLLKFVNTINFKDGYETKTGGVNEENQESVTSILQAMIVAFILILVTMVVQFGSYRQAVLVLLVIPLAVSSVFWMFALTGTPLSFPALIGVLSLFGIVVTNSMFIVDKINLNRREGMEFKEAIADGGASRMEPIILTKLCTVLGLLPITLADPLWRGLGGAIISGLLISSTIMLLFIPVVYYSWFKPSSEATS